MKKQKIYYKIMKLKLVKDQRMAKLLKKDRPAINLELNR
ncbi:hypothetical protein FHS86_002033 [Roseimarinus sediminis]|jgi:hypothetical protein